MSVVHQCIRIPATLHYSCSCGVGLLTHAEAVAMHEFIDKQEASYSPILRQCADIADDREPKYGDAVSNMEDIADRCQRRFGFAITPLQVVQVFLATKEARQATQHQEDNILDEINYDAIQLLLYRKYGATRVKRPDLPPAGSTR